MLKNLGTSKFTQTTKILLPCTRMFEKSKIFVSDLCNYALVNIHFLRYSLRIIFHSYGQKVKTYFRISS